VGKVKMAGGEKLQAIEHTLSDGGGLYMRLTLKEGLRKRVSISITTFLVSKGKNVCSQEE
jgi:hypothetical protein